MASMGRFAIVSYALSAVFYLLGDYSQIIVVRSVQPNGLAQVDVPYGGLSLLFFAGALGFFFFGTSLSLLSFLGVPHKNRPFLASALLSAGLLAVLSSWFLYAINMQDAATRCLNGCAASLEASLFQITIISTILAASGLASAGFGVRLLLRKTRI